jgi:hypothetical protein
MGTSIMLLASTDALPRLRAIGTLALAGLCLIASGCATSELGPATDGARGLIVQTPTNFETALKQNQAALAARQGPPDVALYNIGVILAHQSNPKRDPAKALYSFRTLLSDHPRSAYAEQSKTWIQVLDQQQKLAEEKRALAREKEMLLQERQKLTYANEKSQQLDIEIEKRRRQLLGK